MTPRAASLVHRVHASGDEAAPQRDVDQRTALEADALRVEGRSPHGRRVSVEGHIDRRRRAAGGQGPRAGLKALPIGATRLVEVHVGVEYPGQ